MCLQWGAGRGEILETASLNRAVSDVSPCVTKRKPFAVLVEGLSLIDGRGDWHSFEPLLRAYLDAFLAGGAQQVDLSLESA